MLRKLVLFYLLSMSALVNASEDLFFDITNRTCIDHADRIVPLKISSDIVPENEVAWATIDSNGTPVIFINKTAYEYFLKVNKYSLAYILLHECGHHFLGHVSFQKAFMVNSYAFELAELNADCYAGVVFAGTYKDIDMIAALKDSEISQRRIDWVGNCTKTLTSK